MKYIASCSFGKDSLATILLALEHNEPLDEVVYCEVMFDEDISGEVPEHREFIQEIAIPKLRRWGINVTTIRGHKTYTSCFKSVIGKGDRIGKLWGFPICGRCWINRDCKVRPIERWKKTLPHDVTWYLGIEDDEIGRLLKLNNSKISLLDKYGVGSHKAFDICRAKELVSPAYGFTNRGGCFFCPNAKEKELRHLYDHHPDLWARMLELQALPNKATDKFNREMRFDEIDANFRFDDAQELIEGW